MTPSTPSAPRTVADLVLDKQAGTDSAPPGDAPSAALHERLSAVGRDWLRRQVITRLRELLDLTLADALVDIWAIRGRIADAARETADDPNAERLVEIAQQQATLDQDVTISVVYDELWKADFQGKATVTFDVATIEAVIRGGCLARVSLGHCRATGSFELEGNIVTSRTITLPVEVELDFDQPIDLVRRGAPHAAALSEC